MRGRRRILNADKTQPRTLRARCGVGFFASVSRLLVTVLLAPTTCPTSDVPQFISQDLELVALSTARTPPWYKYARIKVFFRPEGKDMNGCRFLSSCITVVSVNVIQDG